MPDEMKQENPQATPPAETTAQAAPQQPAPAQTAASKGTSGMGIASLVLGILAILTSFLPIINNGSFFLAILGAIFAIVGIIATKNGKKSGRGMAIAGLVLNIVSVAIVLATQSLFSAAIDKAVEESNTPTAANTVNATPEQEEGSAAAGTAPSQASSAPEAVTANEAQSEQGAEEAMYAISIDGVRLGEDYQGNEVAIVSYTWTNNSDEATAFAYKMHAEAFQNNVEITDIAVVRDLDESGYMAEVKPGGTVSFEWAYPIKDHSDLTVEISPLFSFNDELLAEKTFPLE